MFEDLFATPIYYQMLSDKDIQNEIDKIIGDVKFDLKEEWGQTHYPVSYTHLTLPTTPYV